MTEMDRFFFDAPGDHLARQIHAGGGALVIDRGLDSGVLDMLREQAEACGRQADIHVIAPAHPDISAPYTPLLGQDADEISAHIMAMTQEDNGGRSAVAMLPFLADAVPTIVAAAMCSDLPRNFGDLATLFTAPRALIHFARRANECIGETVEMHHLRVLLETYGHFGAHDKGIASLADRQRMLDALGLAGGRLFLFSTGPLGRVLNGRPGASLHDLIDAGRIVYVALPSTGRPLVANAFGRLVVSDLLASMARRRAAPKPMRQRPPFAVFIDSAAEYAMATAAMLRGFARHADTAIFPALGDTTSIEYGTGLMRHG